MEYIYISYGEKERKTAEMFHTYLKNHGLDCWMAPIDIPEGSNFGSEFKKRIKNCSLFFLILSKSAQSSIYADNELEQAIIYDKPILAVKVEEMDMSSDFIFYLLDHQTIFIDEFEEVDSFDEIPQQMELLLKEIKKFIN